MQKTKKHRFGWVLGQFARTQTSKGHLGLKADHFGRTRFAWNSNSPGSSPPLRPVGAIGGTSAWSARPRSTSRTTSGAPRRFGDSAREAWGLEVKPPGSESFQETSKNPGETADF